MTSVGSRSARLLSSNSKAFGYRRTSSANWNDLISWAKIWQRCPIDGKTSFALTRTSKDPMIVAENLQLGRSNIELALSRDSRHLKVVHRLIHNFYDMCFVNWLSSRSMTKIEEKSELLEGGQMMFTEVLRATREKDYSLLEEYVKGRKTLDFHRPKANQLTQQQRKTLEMTVEDFLPVDGLILKANAFENNQDSLCRYLHNLEVVSKDASGAPFPNNDVYLKYAMMLGALHKKKQVLKLCEAFPLTSVEYPMHLRMPAGYGFRKPQYVIVELEFCRRQTYPGKIAPTFGDGIGGRMARPVWETIMKIFE